jgi:hypothetical protein
MNPNLIWIFAVGAVALAIVGAWATSSLGTKISGATYFGVFAVAGFAATFLTRAKTGMGVVAFLVAALLSAGVYYYLVSAIFSGAVETMSTASGADTAAAAAAGTAMGSAMGIFTAIIMLLVSLVAGIGGILAGSKGRKILAKT